MIGQTRQWGYVTKQGEYTKQETDQLLAGIKQFTYKVAATLPEASADTMWIIYLIPSTNTKTRNVKDEFITVATTTGSTTTYAWEQIGTTTPNLSGYLKTSDLPAAIAAAVMTLPTTDPAVAGKLWTDSGTVKVSAGSGG